LTDAKNGSDFCNFRCSSEPGLSEDAHPKSSERSLPKQSSGSLPTKTRFDASGQSTSDTSLHESTGRSAELDRQFVGGRIRHAGGVLKQLTEAEVF
jgi:hypothetical protein